MFSFELKVDKRGINRITYQKGRYCQKLWDILLPHFKYNNVLELQEKAGQKHKQSHRWNESTWVWNPIVQTVVLVPCFLSLKFQEMKWCNLSLQKRKFTWRMRIPEVYLRSDTGNCVTGPLVPQGAIFWPISFSHQKQEFVWRMRIPEGYLRFNNLCYWP